MNAVDKLIFELEKAALCPPVSGGRMCIESGNGTADCASCWRRFANHGGDDGNCDDLVPRLGKLASRLGKQVDKLIDENAILKHKLCHTQNALRAAIESQRLDWRYKRPKK